MLPAIPRELTLHPGPIASIYLDVSRNRGLAPDQVRLRWDALAGWLREQGADEQTLAAAGQAVTENHSQPGAAGRAVFAAGGRVLHVADLPNPPRRESVRWAPLPHLLPLLAQLPEYVPYVVARLGRATATITGVDRAGRDVAGGTAHYSMQHRTEEVWTRTIRSVAAGIDRAVSQLGAELVILTGDVRAASLVLNALGEHSRAITERVPGPGPEGHTGDHPAEAEIRQLAARKAAERTRRVVAQFEQERARAGGLAVTGLAAVIRALQLNQASTVLLRDQPSTTARVWIGPEPAQLALTEDELHKISTSVLGQDRADAALLRAVTGTGAELVLLPGGKQPELADGTGALLRFTGPSGSGEG